MENVILKEIAEREEIIAHHAEKEKKYEEMQQEAMKLEAQVEEILAKADDLKTEIDKEDLPKLTAEIEELRGYAIKLGIIAETKVEETPTAPVKQENPVKATPVDTPVVKTARPISF